MAAKFYAVRKGRTTGIFTSWSQCQQQVTGYPGASFKSFPTRGEAQRFLETGFVGGQADVPQKAEANAEAVAYVDGSYHAGTGEFACGAVIFYQGEAFEKPLCSLKYFDRISLAAGEKQTYTCVLPRKSFESVLENGQRCLLPGEYTIGFSHCGPKQVTAKAAVQL